MNTMFLNSKESDVRKKVHVIRVVLISALIVLFLLVVGFKSATNKINIDLTFCNVNMFEKNFIKFFSKHSKAEKLTICNTNISDISFISNMENLKGLYVTIGDTKINNWESLKDCNLLESFTGINTSFDDLSSFCSNYNLVKLNLRDGNMLKNIDDLIYLENLRELYISSEYLFDITTLGNMEKIECLSISLSPISDINPLSKCTNLKYLDLLGDEYIVDINSLSYLENLEEINLVKTSVTDFDVLFNLPNLQKVVISKHCMSDSEVDALRLKGIDVEEV